MEDSLLHYYLGTGVEAFTTMCNAMLPYPVITGHQVHGCKVAVIDRPDITREDLEGYDAFITNLPGVAIGVRTADCIPILLFDPVHGAVAAIHSGWKGTVRKIVLCTISSMEASYGSRPGDLIAAIGPGIGLESFQVGEEVPRLFKDAGFPIELIWNWFGMPDKGSMSGGHHIDLKAANRWLLEIAGVLPENISCSDICTYKDARFFSARREGFECGRNINSIKII